MDLIKKRRGISNKEVAVNASIIVLEAKKAALRAELRFIITPASFVRRGPVPSRHIIKPTPITTVPSCATSVIPIVINKVPIVGFSDTNKDII